MSLGLIGTLEVAKRGLDTNRQGIELTGHNLSNVSNPAYARQRLRIQTADALPSPQGPIGTGSQVQSIEQVRDRLLDSEIVNETSVSGFLDAKKASLEFAEVNLGQQLDRQSATPEGATASNGVGGQFGITEGLSDFFNAWQALSTSPNSTADRQVVLLKTQSLTDKFNSVSQRLATLRSDLNTRVSDDVTATNALVSQISDLSKSITSAEIGETGAANDLRDRRQQKLEDLSELVNVQYSEDTTTHDFNLVIGGNNFLTNNNITATLQTTTDVNGGTQVQTDTGAAVTLTKGSIWGTIQARDGEIATLQSDVDNLASNLVTQVNGLHATGTALDGTTGRPFFTATSTNAGNIQLNSTLLQDPTLIQASGTGDPGDSGVALQIAKLANQPQAGLANLTFAESYNQTVANLGQALSNTNTQILDQNAVNNMLKRQRDSLGGVSIDEEMANMVVFQRAFQASARMISTLDELLQSVLALGQ